MSITTELREWMENAYSYGTGDNLFKKYYRPWFGWKLVLEPMLDNIDAEHEKAVDAFERDMGMEAMTDENMAKHGWIRQLDADGVPIHIGDEMEADDGTVFVVEEITLLAWGVRLGGNGVDGNGVSCRAYPLANNCRHHHEPTVEDVLGEFAGDFQAWLAYSGPLSEAPENPIAKYAAKLRLAGEGE